MTTFDFSNPRYMDMLNHQVIHMDQGACYNPEYLAGRNMHDYPSRVMQVVRAVWLGEMEATPYGADILFHSILSGQGERWQNFGESPHDYLFCQFIGRELFVQKGLGPAFPAPQKANAACAEMWANAFPPQDGDTALLVDTASYLYAANSAGALAAFLAQKDVRVVEHGPYDTGFSLFAQGKASEAIQTLQALLARLAQNGVKRVVTVSGEGHFMLTVMAKELGLEPVFQVQNLLELAGGLCTREAYLYGGSFYTRYLGFGPRLTALTPNKTETPIPAAWEFQQVMQGDVRVNEVNIWGAPLCAEYFDTPAKAALAAEIFRSAAERIAAVPHAQLAVCDPYAYNMLIHHQFETDKLAYFWDLLQ